MAPREWRLKVADKLSRYKFDDNYDNLIAGLKVDQHTPEKYKELQTAFIKYNDRQDQFRNVKKTWRELLPELEKSISKA
jgi:hypothetical protein